jgi:hypothetical protein
MNNPLWDWKGKEEKKGIKDVAKNKQNKNSDEWAPVPHLLMDKT